MALFFVFSISPNLSYGQKFDTLNLQKQVSQMDAVLSENLKAQSEKTLQSVQKKYPFLQGASIEKVESHLKNLEQKNLDLMRARQAKGGVDSGGGTLIRLSHCLVLLDLYLYNNVKSCDENATTFLLPETKAYQEFGFDRLNSKDILIIQKTFEQIKKWQALSPQLAPRILKAFQKLPIYYTRYQVRANGPSYELPFGTEIDPSQLLLGAYYIKEFGVFIEKKKFDQLNEASQMALLIHEAIRHLQISLNEEMSNETLQKLSAKVMTEPGLSDTLDTDEFMQGAVLNTHIKRQRLILQFSQYINEACQNGLSSICHMNEAENSLSRHFANTLSLALDSCKSCSDSYVTSLRRLLGNLYLRQAAEELNQSKDSGFELSRVTNFSSFLDQALSEFNKPHNFFSIKRFNSAQVLERIRDELKTTGLFR